MTGYTSARRFAEAFVRIRYPDKSQDKPSVNFLAKAVGDWAKVSHRQVTRWIVGDSSPREDRWRKPLEEAMGELDASAQAELAPLLDAVFSQARSAGGADEKPAVPEDIELYLEGISDREYEARARRAPVPVRSLSWEDKPARRDVTSCAEPLAELVALLKQPRRPVRVRLSGPPNSGKDYLCLRVAAEFARSFAASGPSTPLPLLVEWAKLRAAAIGGRDDTIETLLLAIAEGSPNIPDVGEQIRSGRIVIIVRGARLDDDDDSRAWTAAATLLKEADRLLVAWHEPDLLTSEDRGLYTHQLRLLLPPDILATARECRRRLGEADPSLPHLGTLGNGVKLLGTPPLAGRVLSLIGQGALGPLAFSSNSTLAAAVLLHSVISYYSLGNSSADGRGGEHDLDLLPRLHEKWLSLLPGFLTHARDPQTRALVFGDLVRSDATGWVDPSFDGGYDFLENWFAAAPARNGNAALATVDAEGNRLLACHRRNGDPDWKAVVEDVLGTLEADRPALVDRWRAVQNRWSEFEGALGYLRGIIDRGEGREAAIKHRDRALAVLESFWDTRRASEPALGTMRYYGARAASVLFDAAELCRKLERIQETISAGELAFVSEVALRVTGRFYRRSGEGASPSHLSSNEATTCADMVAEQLLSTILSCRQKVPDDRQSEIRHARYHAVAAFVRLAPPPVLRRGAERLLPGVTSEVLQQSAVLRDFAIESATLLGGIRRAGGLWPVVPALTAGYLVECIKKEIEDYDQPPLFVTAHRYQAYQAISPMMLSSRRAKLLGGIFETLPEKQEMLHETAALRYLLYYLRQEIAAGLLPDQDTRRYLEELAEDLTDTELDHDSPEQRNRHDLEEILRSLRVMG